MDEPIARDVAISKLEKLEIEISFIPILCSAPLIYAHSHGFFERNGLSVNLKPAPGWSGIKELLAHGLVDAVHMLSPMPLSCNLGIDGKRADVRLATIQNVNGQALTLAKKHLGIEDVRDMKGFTFGVPYRFSMQYYLLCLFLAENGINPLKDVTISEVAPPIMPYYVEKGRLDGVFGPEPFNQILVHRGIGFIYRLSKDIWPGHPCCSFATSQGFMDRYPNTYRAMLRSVLEAELALHRADAEQKRSIAREIAGPNHLNQDDPVPIEQALAGDFPDGKGEWHTVPNRIDFIPYPWIEYGSWMLSQMQRWAQLPGKVDYREVVESVFQGDTHELAQALGFEKENKANLGGVHPFTGADPSAYMQNQPFSAFQEQLKPLRRYDLDESTGERLDVIIKCMAEVAGGRFHTELEITGDDEIGMLEQAANEMLMNLTFTRDALIDQNERLEARVRERTAALNKEITGHKKSEEALRKEEDKLKRYLESSPDIICVVDLQGIILYVNKATEGLTSYKKAELVGKSFTALNLLTPESQSKPKEWTYRGGAEKSTRSHEVEILKKDGKRVVLDFATYPMGRGWNAEIIAIGRDITEKRGMEEEKQRIEQQLLLSGRLAAVGELAAGVAHELNNPLAAVQGYAQLLTSRTDLDETMRSDLETILREARRAARISSNLLSFARKHEPEKKLILMNEVIEACIELHVYRMKVNNIEIVQELDPALPETLGDFNQLQQVFVNLMTNAEQAMTRDHAKGKLTIKTQRSGATIQVAFADDGPGIEKETLKQVFDPFFTTKEVGEGTGLGLSICFGIVEQHSGTIRVKSKVGEGTTFTVEIPVVTADEVMAEQADSVPTK
ncbi:MAG: ABC transporter substrate-binding protein [Dehalococcoidia bacterium]